MRPAQRRRRWLKDFLYNIQQRNAFLQSNISPLTQANHTASESAELDIVAMAKGLGNGFPIGACLATKKVAACMVPGTHGSTYGGNPLGCAVALETTKHILKSNFLSTIPRRKDSF